MSKPQPPSGDIAATTPPPTDEPKRYFEPTTDGPANEFTREAVPTLQDAVATIKLEDFRKVHLTPCFREANLNGFYAAFVVAGLRFFTKGSIPQICNWAVGGFITSSVVSYEYCMYRRRLEKDGMMKAAMIIEAKKAERERIAAERKAAKEAAAAAAKEAEAAKGSFWKPW
ncbi:hypothetical protein FN846DRAFT_715248 [Sphaerosporella brunnea]|uniref:Cytochrome c oxidase assembly protein COX20, mitochondrial n=1 Tax=Sphaerosporella brunnea TaxID=1250544 RepID=A0A5J5EYC8_9PEZI|nr:hypothetical protein FN846DRAFT_715248 [Sphaerosporella brunnea]